MDIKLYQSEIDEIRETLPMAEIIIDALLANPELNVVVIPDTPSSETESK